MANANFDNIVSSYADPGTSYTGSRYHRSNRIRDDDGDEYLESYDSIEIPKRSDDHYHIVQPSEENRLDLISHKYYGTPLLYWVIAEASGIDDPQVIPSGMTLRIPSRQSLYGNKGVLR